MNWINDPEHWLKRAKEARELADVMGDRISQEAMLRISKDYEVMAKRAAVQRRKDT